MLPQRMPASKAVSLTFSQTNLDPWQVWGEFTQRPACTETGPSQTPRWYRSIHVCHTGVNVYALPVQLPQSQEVSSRGPLHFLQGAAGVQQGRAGGTPYRNCCMRSLSCAGAWLPQQQPPCCRYLRLLVAPCISLRPLSRGTLKGGQRHSKNSHGLLQSVPVVCRGQEESSRRRRTPRCACDCRPDAGACPWHGSNH